MKCAKIDGTSYLDKPYADCGAAMTSKYQIEIHNIGKAPEIFKVFDGADKCRPAQFETHSGAEEGVRIIRQLRNDTAFIMAKVVGAI